MSNGPAFVAKARPKPTERQEKYEYHVAEQDLDDDEGKDLLINRAPMNIATDDDATCTATPASIIMDPMNKAALRPIRSDANGVKGIAYIVDQLSDTKIVDYERDMLHTINAPMFCAELMRPIW